MKFLNIFLMMLSFMFIGAAGMALLFKAGIDLSPFAMSINAGAVLLMVIRAVVLGGATKIYTSDEVEKIKKELSDINSIGEPEIEKP